MLGSFTDPASHSSPRPSLQPPESLCSGSLHSQTGTHLPGPVMGVRASLAAHLPDSAALPFLLARHLLQLSFMTL